MDDKKDAKLEAILPPFETVCIQTFKVYDFCFQAEEREQCYDLTGICDCPFPLDSTVDCTILNTTCQEVSRTVPGANGRANVTFAVSADILITIKDAAGVVLCEITRTVAFTKTVVLCVPDASVETDCEIVNATCSCLLLGCQVCCSVSLCLVIQARAVVKLLIPAFGFCVPTICREVSPGPPFVCPPTLFPPQCTTP